MGILQGFFNVIKKSSKDKRYIVCDFKKSCNNVSVELFWFAVFFYKIINTNMKL